MHLLFCVDEGYAMPLGVALCSLRSHTTRKTEVWIVDYGLQPKSWSNFEKIASGAAAPDVGSTGTHASTAGTADADMSRAPGHAVKLNVATKLDAHTAMVSSSITLHHIPARDVAGLATTDACWGRVRDVLKPAPLRMKLVALHWPAGLPLFGHWSCLSGSSCTTTLTVPRRYAKRCFLFGGTLLRWTHCLT